MRSSRPALLTCAFALASLLPVPSQGHDRVALVIGNGEYSHATKLANPARDAAAIEDLLRQVGFEVVALRDADVEGIYEGLEQFKSLAKEARVGLFYFAGHGVEVDGENFLLPVDAELSAVSQLRTQAVSLETILDDMDDVNLPAKLMILDCCRDNPLPVRSWMATRSAGGGLGAVADGTLPPATMIMFASAPGKVALDGAGGNSPFTKALVEQLGRPGATAFDAFLSVSDSVARSTGERQVPWIKFDGAGRTFRLFSLNSGDSVVRPAMPGVAGGRAFANTLGMRFVPVADTEVLFCEHETRVRDYAAYASQNSGVDMRWKDYEFEGHRQTGDHPVVNVSWEDANGFCSWLSRKEGRTYRLPTDHEWSVAAGIGNREESSASPEDKSRKIELYPWGKSWPPPDESGNFFGTETMNRMAFQGFRDRHPFTAPVKSYSPNEFGIYDLSGNLWEWCQDWYSPEKRFRLVRGGCWFYSTPGALWLSTRLQAHPTIRNHGNGFRVVVEAE